MLGAEPNCCQTSCIPMARPLPETPWHVLHVRSNYEKRVAQHLTVRAVENYVPLYRERVRWTDRIVVTERPLFCGYVFARFPRESRIAAIGTPGVVRSLGDEDGNLVSCAELDKIREGLARGLELRPHPCVSVGARVRVHSGAFDGVEGVVTEFRQQCRVIIALAAIRQGFSLDVDLANIEVLEKVQVSAGVARPQPAFGYGY